MAKCGWPHLGIVSRMVFKRSISSLGGNSVEPVQIRAVRRVDFQQWKQLWDGYNAFYGRSGETALAPEVTLMTWARFFNSYEPVHALVAERGGRLLGLTHYL